MTKFVTYKDYENNFYVTKKKNEDQFLCYYVIDEDSRKEIDDHSVMICVTPDFTVA